MRETPASSGRASNTGPDIRPGWFRFTDLVVLDSDQLQLIAGKDPESGHRYEGIVVAYVLRDELGWPGEDDLASHGDLRQKN